MIHREDTLGDRAKERCLVDLLKRFATPPVRSNVRDDGHDGNAGEKGLRDAADQVGGTRPDRGIADTDLAGGTCMGIGHLCSSLFVPHQDMADVIAAENCIVNVGLLARQTEHRVNV